MITIKSIAKHFDISTAAVSKALNGLPGVSDELRSEILDYARKNYYIPNVYGRGLKGDTLKTLGVIITDNTNPTFSMLLNGIESAADEQSYNIIFCNSNESGRQEEKQIRMLLQKRVDGLLIVPVPVQPGEAGNRYAILEDAKVPYVCMNRCVPDSNGDLVQSDNVYNAALGTQYLIGRGHRNILYASSAKSIFSTREREAGFLQALDEAGLPAGKDRIVRFRDASRADNRQSMLDVLARRRDFTAVFAFNDNMAAAIMQALIMQGLRIPQNVAVLGYDNSDIGEIVPVPLTTIPQDNHHLGRLAVQAVLERIRNERTQRVELRLKAKEVVVRDSA